MINKSILLVISLLASLCMGELVPVSEYIGEHSYQCGYGMGITGAQVDNKLYTFGGCFPIPYIVDPSADNDDPFSMASLTGSRERNNVSDIIQVYDMMKDEWSIEPAKTLVPWRRAKLQTVNQDIYVYDISSRPSSSQVGFWKYSTDIKEWTQLSDLAFIWHGMLKSCQADGKIYFSGSDDGYFRNIVQIYDTVSKQWENPIFLDKKLTNIQHMLCNKHSIEFVAEEAKLFDEDNVVWYSSDDEMNGPKKKTFGVFSSDYDTGITKNTFNVTGNFKKVASKDEWFYFYDVGKSDATISKINTVTFENVSMGTIPYTLEVPLLAPYQDDQVFLFGGGPKKTFGFSQKQRARVNAIKTYNHKLIVSEEKKVEEESINTAGDSSEVKLVLQQE